MRLVLGIGIVGKAAIEYFKDQDLCFYDEIFQEYRDSTGRSVPFFSDWDSIDSVIVSPGFSSDHPMVIEAQNRGLELSTDLAVFLKNPEITGIKIGITGTNGKSTLCALLKYVLGDLAEIGGNFGVSPLMFSKNSFYILELSSYQLYWLPDHLLRTLDIGVITNIGNHHLSYHKTKEEYVRIKNKILQSKHSIRGDNVVESLPYPKNTVFENSQYKVAWNILVQILKVLNLDEKKAAEKLESYIPLRYRQEVVKESPLIINDSKATNIEAMICAIENLRKNFILITQVNDFSQNLDIYKYTLLQKVFVLSKQEVTTLKMPFFVSANFELLVEEAIKYAVDNDYAILFSPGVQSFEFFKNFEHRGKVFEDLVTAFFSHHSALVK